MTLEQQTDLNRQLEGAMASGDKVRIDAAMANILLALIDCQRKTAERVKELCAEAERRTERIKGAKMLWAVLRYIVAAGGGAGLLELLTR